MDGKNKEREENKKSAVNEINQDDGGREGTPEAVLEEAGIEENGEEDPRQKELEDLKTELEATKAKMLRLHADFDNYRKRVQKEREDWFNYAALDLIAKLLPVVDNMERALDSINREEEEIKNLFSGVAMIHRQLLEVLEKEGLKPIKALGEVFDPLFHEAIMQEPPAEGQEDNMITEELRKGYCFKERIVRPTMVKVAKK